MKKVGVISGYLRQEHRTNEQSVFAPYLLKKGSSICWCGVAIMLCASQTFLAEKILELFLWPKLPSLNEKGLGYLVFPTDGWIMISDHCV